MRTKEEQRTYQREYMRRPEAKAKWQKYQAEYRKRPENRAKQRDYLRRYLLKQRGLSEEDYQRLLAEQGGCCAICHRPDSGTAIRLAVDHIHTEGHVRGLLCGSCNRAIGLLRDDPSIIRAAAAYIEKGSKPIT